MRQGIIQPPFKDHFFRADFDADPMPVLSLYPYPAPLALEEVVLSVCGLSQHPKRIPWTMLSGLPRVKEEPALICQIFNWSERVRWEGVRLVDLLDYLKIDTHPEGYFAFYSRDGAFFEGLSRDEARDPRVLLVYGLNDAPLPEAHGGPLRLVVPFLQGYKSVKWLEAIRAYRNDPIGIKRLLGQSPTGALNDTWKSKYQIALPVGKVGDPPLFAPVVEAPSETPKARQAPVSGEIPSTPPPKSSREGGGLLKEVVAVVRPQKHAATRQALEAIGIFSYNTFTVQGRSKQRGLRFRSAGGNESVAIKFLPKQYFSIVIPEKELSAVVAALVKANRTGKGTFGDGKIFVLDLDDAVRISNFEVGAEAAQ
jgi:DMSO/TMAO reductase YedYZ molybdopterin-dependent catalytic subunit